MWVTAIIKLIRSIKKLLRKPPVKQQVAHPGYIIPRNQHSISKTNISINALKVLNRLNSAGFQAYLVGGSVRDLLLGKVPKDFDIATDATPSQIRNLFRNARIIGRRFKLVHILFHREIIEVATFRGSEPSEENSQQVNERGMLIRDNVYGSLDEDAWRRDFTVNSLYYNISDSSIVDFTGGTKDIQKSLIKMIGNPDIRYQEDPVRMLRAIRFSAKLHFGISEESANPLYKLNHLITHVSSSRLFDEVTKLYQCGEGAVVHRLLIQYGLFSYLFKQTHDLLSSEYPTNALIGLALESTDVRIKENKPVTPAFLFAVLLWFPLRARAIKVQEEDELPPLPALEKAMTLVISEQNKVVTIPKRFTLVMREIWLLQFRFSKRQGLRAFNVLNHPRFRAAYDFLALRALSNDESMELTNWWTSFQDADETQQHAMVKDLAITPVKKSKKKRKKEA
jgi:poly(A) polymerase